MGPRGIQVQGAGRLALALLCACSMPEAIDAGMPDAGRDGGPDGGIPELPPTRSPRFNDVWQIATHNSYWVHRGNTMDDFASGIQERVMDQLFFDHVRGLEIDIHPDPDRPGEFGVYHTWPGNSLCTTLSSCLASLRVFAHALPEHEVVTVILELKEIYGPTFDEAHTIEELDALLARELGAALYRPADFLARCPDAALLSDCAAQHGWPTIEELRGRFIVAILGNWDAFGGQATRDWADYALGDIGERAAFPMASAWKLDWDRLPRIEQERITPDELDRAARQSIFLQIQSLDDPRIDPTIARRGVIRVDGAFDPDLQIERIARGMQLMQTDYPWSQHDDRGPAQPFRGISTHFEGLIERGARLALEPGAPAFAYWRSDAPNAWEAAIASGHENARFGCLRAEAEPPALDSIEVCRTKIDADRTEGAVGDPSWEAVTVRVTECRASCTTEEHRAPSSAADTWGDLLGLEIDGACAMARVADGVDTNDAPRWETIASSCFDAPLVRQGIARAADAPIDAGPTLFVGVRRNGVIMRGADAQGAPLIDSSYP